MTTTLLNEFIKKHLIEYKKSVLKIDKKGEWSGRLYEHILPKMNQEKNIIKVDGIDPMMAFRKNNKFIVAPLLHSYFAHLTSSQALAFNLFGPFLIKGKFEFLEGLLGIPLGEVLNYAFEFSKKDRTKSQFDLYVECSSHVKVFFEVKYTENTIATRSHSKNNKQRWQILFKPRMERILKDSSNAYELFFSQYQLWRNIITITDENVYSVFVFLKDRTDLKKQVEDAVRQVKDEYVSRIKIVNIDDICKLGHNISDLKAFYKEFYRKYLAYHDGMLV